MTLAKGLSGGVVPIGAYVARADVWRAAYGKAPLVHTSTFGGSEIACAAALAALDVLCNENLVQNARDRGAQLSAGAEAIERDFPAVIAGVRGRGLLIGVEVRDEGYVGTIVPEMLRDGANGGVDAEPAARDSLGAAARRERGGGRHRTRRVAPRRRRGLRALRRTDAGAAA